MLAYNATQELGRRSSSTRARWHSPILCALWALPRRHVCAFCGDFRQKWRFSPKLPGATSTRVRTRVHRVLEYGYWVRYEPFVYDIAIDVLSWKRGRHGHGNAGGTPLLPTKNIVCMYVCLSVCPNLLRVWLYVCHLLIVKPAVCVGKPSVRATSKICFAAPVWK